MAGAAEEMNPHPNPPPHAGEGTITNVRTPRMASLRLARIVVGFGLTVQLTTLSAGVYQAESLVLGKSDDVQVVEMLGAEDEKALRVTRIHFGARGTNIIVRCQQLMNVTIDGEGSGGEYYCRPDDSGWGNVEIHQSWMAEIHSIDVTYAISTSSKKIYPLIDSITVLDRSQQNVLVPLGLIVWFIAGVASAEYLARRLERRK